MAPVHTWGKEFFVPVSHLPQDKVRIVASEDGTNITQTGGTLLFPPGGQTNLNNLQAGQFVELEVPLSNNGCYIQSDKPVGVCAYLCSFGNLYLSGPSQSWIPAIKQTVTEALIAPFIPSTILTALDDHRALVVTPTDTKNNTLVSIGGALPVALSGGSWIDNAVAGMSFYNMPLDDKPHRFTNDAGLIIMGYGTGSGNSYYYLAGSAMRNLSAAFVANEIGSSEMADHLFCENEITFIANINGISSAPGSLIWYIDDVIQDGQGGWHTKFGGFADLDAHFRCG